jgi:hypothetical protein
MKRALLVGAGVVLVGAAIAGGYLWGDSKGSGNTTAYQLRQSASPITAVASPSTTTTTTTQPTTESSLPPGRLPITVESDAQMRAEGNNGPSSSILLPISCQVTRTSVTAKGSAQGFSEAYFRYGDIIVLYLFTAPSAGFPQGAQLAVSSLDQSPAVGDGSWQVSTTFDPSIGAPARCLVAAQPTHDEQLAS